MDVRHKKLEISVSPLYYAIQLLLVMVYIVYPQTSDFGFSENDSSPVSAVTERENSQKKKINATYEQKTDWYNGFELSDDNTADYYSRIFDTSTAEAAFISYTNHAMRYKLKSSNHNLEAEAKLSAHLGFRMNIDRKNLYPVNKFNEYYLSFTSMEKFLTVLRLGRIKMESGTGLSAHPTFLNPIIGWKYDINELEYKKTNPLCADLAFFFDNGISGNIRYFPKMKLSSIYSIFVPKQINALETSINFNLFEILYNEIGIYWDTVPHLEFSSEFINGPFQIFLEGAMHKGTSIKGLTIISSESAELGPYFYDDNYMYQINENVPKSLIWNISTGVHYDFLLKYSGPARLSLEYVFNQNALQKDEHDKYKLLLNNIEMIGQDNHRYPMFLQMLDWIDKNIDFIDAYQHRIMIRIATVNNNNLQWAGNVIFIGPHNGLLCNIETELKIGDDIALDIRYDFKKPFQKNTLLYHHPLKNRLFGGIRYFF